MFGQRRNHQSRTSTVSRCWLTVPGPDEPDILPQLFLHNYTLIRTIQTRLRSTCHIVHHHVLGCLSSGGGKNHMGNSTYWFALVYPPKIYHWPPIQSKYKGMLSIHASSQVKNCFRALRRKIQTMLPRVKPCCQATNLTSRLLSDDETAPPMHLQLFKLC